MKIPLFTHLFLLSTLSFSTAFSTPVSQTGDYSLLGSHYDDFSLTQVSLSKGQSPDQWAAFTLHHLRIPPGLNEQHATLASLDVLLHGWQTSYFKTRFSLGFGGGGSEISGTTEGVGMGSGQFEIENPRLRFTINHFQLFAGKKDDFILTRIRLSYAPDKSLDSQLNYRIVFEWHHAEINSKAADEDFTPMLRFLYQNLIFEIGHSAEGKTKFNYTIRF